MADVTAAAVKALRERTDLPMMECKKALVQADGDAEKAVEILREQFKKICLLYTSPSPRDQRGSRMPSSA